MPVLSTLLLKFNLKELYENIKSDGSCMVLKTYSEFGLLSIPQISIDTFKQFSGVEELMHYTEADVKRLGVTKSAHRARIVSSLVALRDKAVRLRLGGKCKHNFCKCFLIFYYNFKI